MAAIKIKGDVGWVVPRWIFHYLVDQASAKLSTGSNLEKVLQGAVLNGSFWFSFEELGKSDRLEFREIVLAIGREMESAGSAGFATKEGYEALKARFSELVLLLDDTVD